MTHIKGITIEIPCNKDVHEFENTNNGVLIKSKLSDNQKQKIKDNLLNKIEAMIDEALDEVEINIKVSE